MHCGGRVCRLCMYVYMNLFVLQITEYAVLVFMLTDNLFQRVKIFVKYLLGSLKYKIVGVLFVMLCTKIKRYLSEVSSQYEKHIYTYRLNVPRIS